MSFIHLEDAAAATVLAVEQDRPGIYNIVDDEPAPVREWLPVLADALGAKPARHAPRWLARFIAGDAAVVMGTEARGASNAKAKRELGWTLRYPSWRQGFPAAYASSPDSASRSLNPSRPDQPVAPPPARPHHDATATAQPKDRVADASPPGRDDPRGAARAGHGSDDRRTAVSPTRWPITERDQVEQAVPPNMSPGCSCQS